VSRPVVRGAARRRWAVLAELLVAVGICLAGYYLAAGWFRVHEAAWVVAALHLCGVDAVSAVLPGHILMYRGPHDILDGVVTTSCSSVLTAVGLTALTVSVLRRRKLHAVVALAGALVVVMAANCLRLSLSAMAGMWWGEPAMVAFHDWVGTIWTLLSTLTGFLLMVCMTLPAAERAEQDVAGRHTARRPTSWARPGLGYRVQELEEQRAGERPRRTLTSYVYRYLLPRRVSRRLAARREAGRIDYRIGHKPAAERADAVRRLVDDGLGAHIASLLAVATYDEDPEVLDTLAEAVAARQWEPITNDRVAGLRLWARGWLSARRLEAPTVPAPAAASRGATPHSFARPGTGSAAPFG
jgi:carbamoyl-phosphate synthase large subunit